MGRKYRLKFEMPAQKSGVRLTQYTECKTLYDIAIIHNENKILNCIYKPLGILFSDGTDSNLTIEDAEIAFEDWCAKHTYKEILNRIVRVTHRL